MVHLKGNASIIYEITLKLRTNSDPRDLVEMLSLQSLEFQDILSMDFRLIEERPTNIEHHGGCNE